MNGYLMKVTQNLYEALLQLRRGDEDRILWVDAVCIDQANLKERGHQVAQMGEIYKEADRVIFRLGPGTCETDILMESLSSLQQASVKHACRDWLPQDIRWHNLWASSQSIFEVFNTDSIIMQQRGLEMMLNRSWFRRVWILQEAAFAKAGIISCGTKSVSARLFGLAPRLVGVTPDKHCQAALDIMPSPWRDTYWWGRSRTLYALLKAFGGSEATDKRDLVYALRGMSSDFRDTSKLVPDYEKSEVDVVRDVFCAIYLCELECLESSLRPLSVPELVGGLQSIDGDQHLLGLVRGWPMRDTLDEVLKNCEYIPVNQNLMSTAAQHDDTGEVVDLLLRHRGEELQTAEETFCHQSQAIVPERALVAAAENQRHGDAAIEFLLSLKTEHYDVAAIAEALARNPSRCVRSRITRILLLQQDGVASASALLTKFAQGSDVGNLVGDFLEAHSDYRIAPESASIAAIQNSLRGQDYLRKFLCYCPSEVTITRGIIQAAARSNDGSGPMKLLLENSAVQKPLSVEEQFAVLTSFANKPLMECFLRHHGGGVVSAEAVRATSVYERSTLAALIQEWRYEVRIDDNAIECLVEKFGMEVIVDLLQFRRGQVKKNQVFVRRFLASLGEKEDSRGLRRQHAMIVDEEASEEGQQAQELPFRPKEALHSMEGEEGILLGLLRQVLRQPMADEDCQTWMPLISLVSNASPPEQKLQLLDLMMRYGLSPLVQGGELRTIRQFYLDTTSQFASQPETASPA